MNVVVLRKHLAMLLIDDDITQYLLVGRRHCAQSGPNINAAILHVPRDEGAAIYLGLDNTGHLLHDLLIGVTGIPAGIIGPPDLVERVLIAVVGARRVSAEPVEHRSRLLGGTTRAARHE